MRIVPTETRSFISPTSANAATLSQPRKYGTEAALTEWVKLSSINHLIRGGEGFRLNVNYYNQLLRKYGLFPYYIPFSHRGCVRQVQQ
jgi:hypothetical protein